MVRLHHVSQAVLDSVRRRRVTAAMLVVIVALAGPSASGQEEFEGWHLEPGVSQAQLVMVARVASISRLTVVEGAKTDVALREYRFQPVRMLKGIFQREQLSMTASDLGCPADNAALAPPLEDGEFRLLILVQQRGNSVGCVSAAPGAQSFDERVPRLSGPDDPLVNAVETLIRVADSRSRKERAKLLIDRLVDAEGLSAVPLLSSLQQRADWAAADPRAYSSVARLAGDPQPPVRRAAVAVLRDMLVSGIAPDDAQLDGIAKALRATLQADAVATQVRLHALEALGHLLAIDADIDGMRELLIDQLSTAATRAERAAAATALSRLDHPQAVAAVLDALANLPLDEDWTREADYARAAATLDAVEAERVLRSRLERSIAARQSLQTEARFLGRLQSAESVPLLLDAAAHRSLARPDTFQIAQALGRLGDDRAVPQLVEWMRGDNHRLRDPALTALEEIDSPLAAREVRPLLKTESHLPLKLRLAWLLARHGIDDGYALATEHLADEGQTAPAALVLIALDDARTSGDLSAIITDRPAHSWRAAALTGLAAIGDEAAQQQLFDILSDDRHALVVESTEAAGLTDDGKLLLPLAALVQSRNEQIAQAAILALRRFLAGVRSSPRGLSAVDAREDVLAGPDAVENPTLSPPAEIPDQTRAAIAESLASLAKDAYVSSRLRREAFAVARLLHGPGYDDLLTELADQAELEGTPLLAEVQAERRRARSRDE